MPNTPASRPDVEGIAARAEAASGEQWFAGKMRVDSNGISESLTIGTYEAHEHFEDTICEVWEGNHDAKTNVSFIAHARQDIPALIRHIEALEVRQEKLEAVVAEQAADDGLWFQADSIIEAYFQQELRKLHEIIEGKTSEECALAALDGGGDG